MAVPAEALELMHSHYCQTIVHSRCLNHHYRLDYFHHVRMKLYDVFFLHDGLVSGDVACLHHLQQRLPMLKSHYRHL